LKALLVAVAGLLTLGALLILLRPGPGPWTAPPPKPPVGPIPRLLFVGTSLTARSIWPEVVAQAVEACRGGPVEVVRIAEPGATSAWGAAQAARIRQATADVVAVEFLANDAALHRGVSRSASTAYHRAIIEAAREGGARAVLLVVIGPVRGLHLGLRFFLNDYAAVYVDLADGSFVHALDTRPFWPADARALAALVPDGLHPTEAAMAAHVAGPVSGWFCER
jgi:hypothetical protein